jgi:DNA repair protein RadC
VKQLKLLGSVPEVKMVTLRECPTADDLADNPERIYAFWKQNVETASWFDQEKECFVVFLLNTRRRIKGFNLISLGSLDQVNVHPREVFRVACICAAATIIFAHNHPSGDPTPSEADVKVTRDLIRAGQLMKIDVLDSLVIGKSTLDRPKAYVSLRELGYFY